MKLRTDQLFLQIPGKVVLSKLVVLTLLALFSGCSKMEEPIKIGCILSLSGPGAHLHVMRDGIELAVDEINASGGINGRKIELFIEDSKTDPQEGKRAFQKLEAEHQPLLYIVNNSHVAMVIRDLAEKAKVPLIASPSSATNLTKGKGWTFRYWGNAAKDIPPIVNILNKLKIQKVGMIHIDGAYGDSLLQLMKEDARKSNRVLVSTSFKPKETQFKPQIGKVFDSEAIYVAAYAKNIASIFEQIRALGYSGFLIGASGASDISLRKKAILNNAYVAAPLIYNESYPYARKLKATYENMYNAPLSHFVATGYDIIKLVNDLLAGKEINRDSLKNSLEQGFHYPSSMGDINVAPGNHDIEFPLFSAQIRNGRIHYLSQF